MDVLKTLDSVFTALSLEISKDDIGKYEESYGKLRETIQEELWEEENNKKTSYYTDHTVRGIPVDYEPKRANRFVFYFPEEMGIEAWVVQSVALPKLEIGFIGRKKWDDMEVTMHDLIGPSTTTTVFDRIMNAKNYTVRLELLDPVGHPVQRFNILITGLKNYENSMFHMSEDSLSSIKLRFGVKNIALLPPVI